MLFKEIYLLFIFYYIYIYIYKYIYKLKLDKVLYVRQYNEGKKTLDFFSFNKLSFLDQTVVVAK